MVIAGSLRAETTLRPHADTAALCRSGSSEHLYASTTSHVLEDACETRRSSSESKRRAERRPQVEPSMKEAGKGYSLASIQIEVDFPLPRFEANSSGAAAKSGSPPPAATHRPRDATAASPGAQHSAALRSSRRSVVVAAK